MIGRGGRSIGNYLSTKNVICFAIITFVVIQQLHLVGLANNLAANSDEPTAMATTPAASISDSDGDHHQSDEIDGSGDTEVGGSSNVNLDDDEYTINVNSDKSEMRARGLGDYFGSFKIFNSGKTGANNHEAKHHPTEVEEDPSYSDHYTNQNNKEQNEEGSAGSYGEPIGEYDRTTSSSAASSYKVVESDRSYDDYTEADKPRVISGFGLGLGKGLIG